MANYFNTLSLRDQLKQLGQCRFMESHEFSEGVAALKGKKIVIIGCGAQGLNQGLNMRDSGLDISYTLRPQAIAEKRQSYINATENGFTVGTYEELIPDADLLIRTGGERRISNVLLWNLAYSELWFTDTLWPEFDKTEFDRALNDYAGKQRRYGHTGDQVEATGC